MAKSATGKWVSKVGASGGSKAYKKERPSNYYAVLILIVVLGLASTVLARYDYQHPASAATGTPPAVGTTWFASLAVDACGENLPYIKSNATSTVYGLKTLSYDVIEVSPISSADSGNHATLAQYGVETPGLVLGSNELAIPTAAGTANSATTYRNGELWKTFAQKKPILTTNPSTIHFVQDLRVTLAFVPKGVTPLAPSTSTVNAMVQYQTASATTTTTLPTAVTTTTTATTTTAPTTTTTAKG